jgi:hypothetical protein
MRRRALLAVACLVALGAAALCRGWHAKAKAAAAPLAPTASASAPATLATSEIAPGLPVAPPAEDEASFMGRLRAADPTTALELAREGDRRYGSSTWADEREVRRIDALVALDRIGEAHSDALLFVQHHRSGPLFEHVANLMGVHPRPPGAVPEPEAKAREGR